MPHHSMLALPFDVLVENVLSRKRFQPNIQSDSPETRGAELNGKCIDVSKVYTRFKDVLIFAAEWAVDCEHFQRLEMLEASLECQVLSTN